jgi:multiple sugar transport system permease protein
MQPSLSDRFWPSWGRVWLLAPFFVFLSLFWLTPLGKGLLLSLESDTLFGESTFVGLQHYRDLLFDSRYWRAVLNTAVFTLATVTITIALALVFAHALRLCNRRVQGPLAFGLMIPGLCPPTVLALLFLLVFHGQEGLLNRWILQPLGFETINWLSDPDFILAAVVIQAIWRWTGFMAFFLLCALNARPQEILDAAKMDGAGIWNRFVHITLPLIAPTLTFCLIYLIIDCFAQFAGSYVLFGGSGGTNDAGLLLVTYAYQKAFIGGGFGSGAAVSLSIVPWLGGALVLVAMIPRFIWKEGATR